MSGDPMPPPDDEPRGLRPYRLETIDVTRLHALLSDAKRTRAIGESIVKALIADVLRSKLAFDGPGVEILSWSDSGWFRSWGKSIPQALAEVSKVVQEVLVDVSLSKDEQQIVQQLALRLNK